MQLREVEYFSCGVLPILCGFFEEQTLYLDEWVTFAISSKSLLVSTFFMFTTTCPTNSLMHCMVSTNPPLSTACSSPWRHTPPYLCPRALATSSCCSNLNTTFFFYCCGSGFAKYSNVLNWLDKLCWNQTYSSQCNLHFAQSYYYEYCSFHLQYSIWGELTCMKITLFVALLAQ